MLNSLFCGTAGRKDGQQQSESIPQMTASEAATAAQEANKAGDGARAIKLYSIAIELEKKPAVQANYCLAAGNIHLERSELPDAIRLHVRSAKLRVAMSDEPDLVLTTAVEQADAALAKAAGLAKAAAEAAACESAAGAAGGNGAAEKPAKVCMPSGRCARPSIVLCCL